MGDLTHKQEGFAQMFVETSNAAEAYRQNYNVEKMSDNAIYVEASRLLDNPKVSLRVEELKKASAQRHVVTVDKLSGMLTEAFDKAKGTGQTSAMVQATLGLGKLHGLIVDKKEVTNKKPGANDLSDGDLADIAARGRARASEEAESKKQSDRVH